MNKFYPEMSETLAFGEVQRTEQSCRLNSKCSSNFSKTLHRVPPDQSPVNSLKISTLNIFLCSPPVYGRSLRPTPEALVRIKPPGLQGSPLIDTQQTHVAEKHSQVAVGALRREGILSACDPGRLGIRFSSRRLFVWSPWHRGFVRRSRDAGA